MMRGGQEERGRDRESALVIANKVTWRTRGFCTNCKSRGRGGSERGRRGEGGGAAVILILVVVGS